MIAGNKGRISKDGTDCKNIAISVSLGLFVFAND